MPADVKAGDVILNLSGEPKNYLDFEDKSTNLTGSSLAVTMGAENRYLNVNDKIALIRNPNGILYPKDMTNYKERLQAMAGISTIYEFNLKKDSDAEATSGKNLYAVVAKKDKPA